MNLNAKLLRDGGSKRLIVNNGFECQTVNDGSKRQTRDTMALNTKLWGNGGFERLTVHNGSECQTVNDGSKHQTTYTTLNAKLNNDSECQTKNMALNIKLKQTTTLNAKMKMRL